MLLRRTASARIRCAPRAVAVVVMPEEIAGRLEGSKHGADDADDNDSMVSRRKQADGWQLCETGGSIKRSEQQLAPRSDKNKPKLAIQI